MRAIHSPFLVVADPFGIGALVYFTWPSPTASPNRRLTPLASHSPRSRRPGLRATTYRRNTRPRRRLAPLLFPIPRRLDRNAGACANVSCVAPCRRRCLVECRERQRRRPYRIVVIAVILPSLKLRRCASIHRAAIGEPRDPIEEAIFERPLSASPMSRRLLRAALPLPSSHGSRRAARHPIARCPRPPQQHRCRDRSGSARTRRCRRTPCSSAVLAMFRSGEQRSCIRNSQSDAERKAPSFPRSSESIISLSQQSGAGGRHDMVARHGLSASADLSWQGMLAALVV